MCQARRRDPAPSTAADSYNWVGIAAMAAKKMIVPHPTSFQITCEVSRILNVSAFAITLTLSNPSRWNRSAKAPAPPRTCCQTAITITQDRKCGR